MLRSPTLLRPTLVSCLLLFLASSVAYAGGAWVPDQGDGDVQFGFSRNSERTPSDRFGSRSSFNFNDASMGLVSMGLVAASFLLPFGERDQWWVEAGYGMWVWGRSARQYEEPFFSVGKSF